MTNAESGPVNMPISLIRMVEERRMELVDDLSNVRLALKIIDGDVPTESLAAYMKLIDQELVRIQQRMEEGLQKIPALLTSAA
ncbi:hypothetical protein [Microbulbifer variabilis]|uniref:hypothetical protein n=1 Tax=Microbulbifer variabilis TaxID=266805 RepID=UPI001CFDB49E|nr:hypothetical protein [Microbulbifer variabilis]